MRLTIVYKDLLAGSQAFRQPDDLMPAHLARPDSIDLPGLGLTVVTSLGITGWPPVHCATQV